MCARCSVDQIKKTEVDMKSLCLETNPAGYFLLSTEVLKTIVLFNFLSATAGICLRHLYLYTKMLIFHPSIYVINESCSSHFKDSELPQLRPKCFVLHLLILTTFF